MQGTSVHNQVKSIRIAIGLARSVILLIVLGSVVLPALDAWAAGKNEVVLHLFWGQGCPHCEEEKEFLKQLVQEHPELTIKAYEVWHDKKNAALFERIIKAVRAGSSGVPTTVIGNKVFIGFSEQKKKAIKDAVASCKERGCPDTLDLMLQPISERPHEEHSTLQLPLFGELDLEKLSLPVLTVIIGGMDSFNPCAFYVLLFLMSLLIHARSRKRMLFIGGIFVFFSGIVYFLFMAAWLNVFLVIGQLTLITLTAGIVAILVAVINIKDFFFFKHGISLVIPEQAKPTLFSRMRGLISAPTLPAMATGTIVLAVTANAYELLCTAGFPMVYTRALTLHDLTRFQYYLYLALYNLVYVIPLALIVVVMTVTLGTRKLTEWQGRRLKLVSGLMMLALGAVLLIDPALMNNVIATIVMFTAVLIASWLIIAVTKKIRPDIAAGQQGLSGERV